MAEPFENTPVVIYGKDGDSVYSLFYRICPICGRFVKNDERTASGETLGDKPNATCKKCGRVQMPFCDWVYEEDLEDLEDG